MTVAFKGFNTHPGYAKGRMVNAIRVAADFVAALPRQNLSPETTDGYDGYVHPSDMSASVDHTVVKVLLRDFVTANLAAQRELVVQLAQAAAANHPGCAIDIDVREQYRNMREVLDQHPLVVDRARQAIRNLGLEPVERPIRGGTDGSRLSFMGLPTPNIFAGEHNFLPARMGVEAGHGSRGAGHRGNRALVGLGQRRTLVLPLRSVRQPLH